MVLAKNFLDFFCFYYVKLELKLCKSALVFEFMCLISPFLKQQLLSISGGAEMSATVEIQIVLTNCYCIN